MDGMARRAAIFTPDPAIVAASQITAFTQFCATRTGRRFADDGAFHRFSVSAFRLFWRLLLEWSGLPSEGGVIPACTTTAASTLFMRNTLVHDHRRASGRLGLAQQQ